ncbi:MAG: molybdenum cofactor guanylyltransferase [Terriglobia bacterium]
MTGVAEPISAFVLAGGKSSRMGRDKSLLTFCGRYLIEYAIEVLRHHTDDIRIIGDPDKYQFLKLPVLADRIASNGPLSGIYTGLDVARTEFSLFIACDMPLMRPEFLGLLLDHAARADAVAFKSADGKWNHWPPSMPEAGSLP